MVSSNEIENDYYINLISRQAQLSVWFDRLIWVDGLVYGSGGH